MFESLAQKLKASNEALEKKHQVALEQKSKKAEELSAELNSYLLKNKNALREFLIEAGDKASVDIGARGALNPTAEPALKITKNRDWNGSTAIVVTVDAPDRHQQPEDLCIRVHRHVTNAYRMDDGHYSHYYKPSENGIKPWAYPNGYCGDRDFKDDLMGIDFTPPPEEVIKNIEHQAKKIARKF